MVQDDAAALVVTAALAPQRGDTLLDTCAAPGGKSLFAASCMRAAHAASEQHTHSNHDPPLHTREEGGLVVAMDVSAARVGLLQKTAELWGLQEAFVLGACDVRDAVNHTYALSALLRAVCMRSRRDDVIQLAPPLFK